MMEFAIYVFLVACAVKFLRTLAIKWGILEWLQVNAPNKFLYELFTCEFCQSFWLGMGICAFLSIFVHWWLLFVPIFSSTLRW
nr:MAG TPA: Protein of unknown function (DUF1360) [Caudoviricetes sp.]